MKDFFVAGRRGLGKAMQKIEDKVPTAQIPAGQFSNYEGMFENLPLVQEINQPVIAFPEMIDPDRRVDEDHTIGSVRRRGTGWSSFMDPPRAARRRALSRAIRVSSPRRTRDVFSRMPVSSAAVRRRVSSMFRVVLICIDMLFLYIFVKPKPDPPYPSIPSHKFLYTIYETGYFQGGVKLPPRRFADPLMGATPPPTKYPAVMRLTGFYLIQGISETHH
jgi:hypothetical protein